MKKRIALLLILMIICISPISALAADGTNNTTDDYLDNITQPSAQPTDQDSVNMTDQIGVEQSPETSEFNGRKSFFTDPLGWAMDSAVNKLLDDNNDFLSLGSMFLAFAGGAQSGLDSPLVQSITHDMQSVALLLVTVIAMWLYLRRDIVDDDDTPLSATITKVVLTIAAILLVPYIIGKLLTFSTYLMAVISQSNQILSALQTDALALVLRAIFFILTFIQLFKIYISIAKRTIMLVIWMWVGPLASLSLIGEGTYFKNWFGSVFACAVQPAAQFGVLILGSYFAGGMQGGLLAALTMFASLVLAIEIPNIISGFLGAQSPGGSSNRSTLGRTIGIGIRKLLRF